jgi:hypothetical protein
MTRQPAGARLWLRLTRGSSASRLSGVSAPWANRFAPGVRSIPPLPVASGRFPVTISLVAIAFRRILWHASANGV